MRVVWNRRVTGRGARRVQRFGVAVLATCAVVGAVALAAAVADQSGSSGNPAYSGTTAGTAAPSSRTVVVPATTVRR